MDSLALPVKAVMSEAELRGRIAAGIPPETAEEYLLRVRLEAMSIPDTITVASPAVTSCQV